MAGKKMIQNVIISIETSIRNFCKSVDFSFLKYEFWSSCTHVDEQIKAQVEKIDVIIQKITSFWTYCVASS